MLKVADGGQSGQQPGDMSKDLCESGILAHGVLGEVWEEEEIASKQKGETQRSVKRPLS